MVFGITAGVGLVGSMAFAPVACLCCGTCGTEDVMLGLAGAGVIGTERTASHAAGTVKRTVETACKIAGVPCVCGHKSMQVMKEIEDREEQKQRTEEQEEDRRNRLKELPDQ